MAEKSLVINASNRLKEIHGLSLKFNKLVGKPHQERLLELMRKHVDEIEDLVQKNDPHYLIETGDLLILCFELLLEGGADMDEVMLKCFGRYERKLTGLIKSEKRRA
ncbi:MAG: hypothetical protein AB1650_05525 [Candidatus Omnitrophota bacterium]